MKKQNKLTKIAAICTLGLTVSLIPTKANAFMGAGDLNIDVMQQLVNYLLAVPEQIQSASGQSTLEAFNKLNEAQQSRDNANNSLKVKADRVKANIEALQKTLPSFDVCNKIVQNRGLIANSGAINSKASTTNFKSNIESEVAGDANKQISGFRELISSENLCSEVQAKYGLNGCNKNSKVTEKSNLNNYSTVQSTVGTQVVVKGDDGKKAVATTATIDNPKVTDAFLKSKYGIDPQLVSNYDKNNQSLGAEYNAKRATYLARKNTARTIEVEQSSNYYALPKPPSFWSQISEDEWKGLGYTYPKPKNPSQRELIGYIINKQLEGGGVINSSVSGGQPSLEQMQILQAKLTFDLLKAQENTNRILSSILLQSLDPITNKELEGSNYNRVFAN